MLIKFILRHNGINGIDNTIYPDLSAAIINNKEFLLNKEKGYDDFFPKETIFSPLRPKYIGDFLPKKIEIESLLDFPGWIEKSPKGNFYPVSDKFKKILLRFNFPPHIFYYSEVLINKELVPFNVVQFKFGYHESLIDFDKSTFCNVDFFTKEKLSDDHEIITSFKEMRPLKLEKGWKYVGFNKAVMKPQFELLDLLVTRHFGLLISERLKNAIESAGITGVKIEECPTQFEINYDIEQNSEETISKKEPSQPVTISKQEVKNTTAVFEDGLRIYSQEEMDNFKLKYPDCKTIIGNVHIFGATNMDAFHQIERINGCLFIRNIVENLEGLSNLKSIGGELYIASTSILKSLKGLDNLEEVQSNGEYYYSPEEMGISIEDNQMLEDLSALKQLKKIKYNIHIGYNQKLNSLNGLEGIKEVGDSLIIQKNDSLTDLSALSNLENLQQSIIIIENPTLNKLKGLHNIKSAQSVKIKFNGTIPTIDRFENLQKQFN